MSCTNITNTGHLPHCNDEGPDSFDPNAKGDREFNSDNFYSVLWLLVILLSLIALTTLYGLYKIGRIPPPEKRPTES